MVKYCLSCFNLAKNLYFQPILGHLTSLDQPETRNKNVKYKVSQEYILMLHASDFATFNKSIASQNIAIYLYAKNDPNSICFCCGSYVTNMCDWLTKEFVLFKKPRE